MFGTLGQIALFLAENEALIGAIREAIEGGMTKAELLQVIRQAQIAASDAAMDAALGPPTRRP